MLRWEQVRAILCEIVLKIKFLLPCIKTMCGLKYFVLIVLLINSVGGLNIVNENVMQPTCSNTFGSISFDISNVVGVVNIVWTPALGNITNATNLVPGTYSFNVSDDVSWQADSKIISVYTPMNVSEYGTYRTYHHFSSIYLEMNCAHSTNPNYVGYAHGYGFSNVTKNVPRNVTGGIPPYSYLWSAPYGSFDDPTLLQPVYYPDQPLTLFNLTLQVTDSVGCVAYSTIPYVLQMLDVIVSVAPASIGKNDGTMNFTFFGRWNTTTPLLLYIESTANNFNKSLLYSLNIAVPINSTQSGYQDYTYAGFYQYDYDFTPSYYGWCLGQINFTVPNKLTFNNTLPTYTTFFDKINITSDGTAPFTYSWSPITGLGQPNQENPVFLNPPPTHYTLTITDANGVSGSMSTIYNSMSIGGVDTSGFIDINSDGGYVYNFNVIMQNGLPPYVYSWSPAWAVSNATIPNPAVTIPVGTSQVVTLIVSDATGLTLTYNTTVTNYLAAITSFNTSKVCGQYTGSLTDVIISSTPRRPWEIRRQDPPPAGFLIATGVGTVMPNQYNLIPGNYSIDLPYAMYYGNPAYNPLSFFEILDDGVNVSPTTLHYCQNEQMVVNTIQTGLNYMWSSSDPAVTILTPTTLQPSLQTVLTHSTLTLTITSDTCVSVRSITVVFETPVITITSGSVSCNVSTPDGTITVAASVCSWSDSATTSCARTGLSAGTYTVSYTDGCGMIHTETVILTDPNTIDSDGDGVPNCDDGCPLDPHKTQPGQCGCGNADIDVDNDGVPACLDLCDTNCQTVEVCPNTTSIPAPPDDVSVQVRIHGLNIYFNVTAYKDNTTLVNLGIAPLILPLQEIDLNDTVIQSIDLAALTWYQSLIRYDGYRLLTSVAVVLLDDTSVRIVWRNYFFDAYCYRNLTCLSNSTNATSPDMLSPGDSKIAFQIDNWPFRSEQNRLRTSFQYNITDSFTGKVDQTDTDTEKTFRYRLSDGFILVATYLRQCWVDNAQDNVTMLAYANGRVDIIFPHFTKTLQYDPIMSFLFSGLSFVNSRSWTRFEGPIIAVSICIGIGLALIVASYTKMGHKIILGEESYRVLKLRSVSENVDSIEQNDQISRDQAKRQVQHEYDIESDTSSTSGESDKPITTENW